MYALKQIVGALANPLSISMLIAAAGALLQMRRWRRMGRGLIVAAVSIAYLTSTATIGDLVLGALERNFAPMQVPPRVKYVVVLGSGYAPRAGIPVTAALTSDAVVRLVEGVRLVRQLDSAALVLSGGAPPGRTASAHGYAVLAEDLGIDPASMILLSTPMNTAAEMRELASVLRDAPFILVTSSFHMTRSMALAAREGLDAAPAPTGHLVDNADRWSWRCLLPTAGGLRKTELAAHEYLGLAAIAMSFE